MTKVAAKSVGIRTTVDIGEPSSAQSPAALYAQRTRFELSPGEESASLPNSWNATAIPFQSLNEYLGPLMTVANPAWGSDAVARMRALQKRLIAHSLEREEDGRRSLMGAISAVEDAVQLRLRLEQMQIADEDIAPLSAPVEPSRPAQVAPAAAAGGRS